MVKVHNVSVCTRKKRIEMTVDDAQKIAMAKVAAFYHVLMVVTNIFAALLLLLLLGISFESGLRAAAEKNTRTLKEKYFGCWGLI